LFKPGTIVEGISTIAVTLFVTYMTYGKWLRLTHPPSVYRKVILIYLSFMFASWFSSLMLNPNVCWMVSFSAI